MRTTACFWLLSSVLVLNLRSVPSTPIIGVFLAAALLLVWFFPRCRPAVAGVLLALMTLSLSFWQLASHQLSSTQVSKDLTINVQITGVPEQQAGRLVFMANVVSCESCQRVLHVKKISLSWYGASPEIRAGEIWRLTVRLKPPTLLRNAGGFDAVAWALVNGLHAKGYVRKIDSARRLSDSTSFTLSALRQAGASRLAALADSNTRIGLLQALTVGLKTHITDEQWRVLRNTGTAHLLAISGLHIGLVAGWAILLGRRLGTLGAQALFCLSSGRIRVDPRPWVLTSALCAALVYAGLAGFELPTQRAVLMLSVWVIAAVRFRFLPPMTALSVALIVVLSMNALSLLSAGFWLSFGTVAALFYLHGGHQAQGTAPTVGIRQAAVSKALSLCRVHIFLGIVLLPVSAWFFQSGSLIAPLANLVAVPWVAMVSVPLSLLALAASQVSETIAILLLNLADRSLQTLFAYLNFLDSTNLSAIVLTLPGVLAFIMVMTGLLVFFAPRGLGLRWLALPLFLPAVLYNTSVPASDGFEVHVLDVGQGLAVLVFAGQQTLLFDTGGKVSPELSMFEAVVVPFLQASGRRQVDTLVVSHGDEDHAFGVNDVVRRYPDVGIFSSQMIDVDKDLDVRLCHAGYQWNLEGVQFAFIHPAEADKGGDNNRSCVLMIFMGKSRVLLTGDIEAPAEQRLVSRLRDTSLFPVTLLTAPHHGSSTSSSQIFLEKLRPEFVVFPAGSRNRYGFPHSDVQLRYKLTGSKSFTTGKKGAVSFIFDREGLGAPPTIWWNSRRRFWHGIVNPDCWQRFAGQSLALRLLALSQKGQILCGK